MIKMGVIEEICCCYASPVVFIPKPGCLIHFCVDYRLIDDVILPDAYPLPLVEDLIDKVGQAKYRTEISLCRGYWQIPIENDSVPISAFVTPYGQRQWKFGLWSSKCPSNLPKTCKKSPCRHRIVYMGLS